MTKLISVRLDEPLIEIIDALVEAGIFENRSQGIRALLCKAINSNDIVSILPPRLKTWIKIRYGGQV